MLVIQISGYKGSGKDTLANYLWENVENVQLHAYADKLKQLFGWKTQLSLQDIEIGKRNNDLVYESIRKAFPSLDVPNVRNGLILAGKQLREEFGAEFFINTVKTDIEICEDQDTIHIITDMRYKNEYNAFPDALRVRVDRQSCKTTLETEGALDDEYFDLFLNNNTTIENYMKECEVVANLIN